jgi:hypothetical protein
VQLRVPNQTRDIMVLKQRIREDLGWSETVPSVAAVTSAGSGVRQLRNRLGAERDLLQVRVEERHDGHELDVVAIGRNDAPRG